MEEKLSLMFDGARSGLVVVLCNGLPELVQYYWDRAHWTWDQKPNLSRSNDPAWVGNILEAIKSDDFVAVRVPCEFLIGEDHFSGALYVEAFPSGQFYVAVTPSLPLWADEVEKWIKSSDRYSRTMDQSLADVTFRIGTEVSMPMEPGGSLIAVVCRSVNDVIVAYLRWRMTWERDQKMLGP